MQITINGIINGKNGILNWNHKRKKNKDWRQKDMDREDMFMSMITKNKKHVDINC